MFDMKKKAIIRMCIVVFCDVILPRPEEAQRKENLCSKERCEEEGCIGHHMMYISQFLRVGGS
jgi:hypothetical protein